MLEYITNNLSTIIISLGLLVIVVLIIRGMHKGGKGICGSKCEDCASELCDIDLYKLVKANENNKTN